VKLKYFVAALGLTVGLLGCLAGNAAADGIPAGWTCSGTCGSSGADGVVPLSPIGSASYQWVSTINAPVGVGGLPTGLLGHETNGSTLFSPTFSATANTALNFYFNYVTSDGAGFADYAWAELFDSSNNPVALLFTARTLPSGSIVPGSGLPNPLATLTPPNVPIVSGGPAWSPLGGSSGKCFDAGCGYTGWINSNYTIGTAGNYYLGVGVVNWLDTAFQSGLALDGVTVGGVPVGPGEPPPTGTPEPGSLLLLAAGVPALLLLKRRA
jgi:hypothetical protein